MPIKPHAFVLVGTTHPGNIGASARALKTMGHEELRLAGIRCAVDTVAETMAGRATDILATTHHYAALDEAVADCQLVLGVTARERRSGVPAITPRAAATQASATARHGGRAALVFGREHAGLTNDEAARCHRLVHIPANPEYPSLNLAAAVQILAYELRLAATADAEVKRTQEGEPLATASHTEAFYASLARVVALGGYGDPTNDRALDRRLRRLFGRVQLEHGEVNLLQGIFAGIERRLRRRERDPE